MVRLLYQSLLILALVLLAACQPQNVTLPQATMIPVDLAAVTLVAGELIYVPAYSEVFYGARDLMPLAATLTIHNTDLEQPIIVRSVQYFDTDGNLIREYVPAPFRLAPMATTGFVVAEADRRGGWGANFLVEWGAVNAVEPPLVEAIMVSTQGTHGLSFISPGRVLSRAVRPVATDEAAPETATPDPEATQTE